jgi:hypothetical protein
VPSQQLQGQLQSAQRRYNNSIQFNSPEANYKVSTGKKMRRVRSKKVSENNVLIKIEIIIIIIIIIHVYLRANTTARKPITELARAK